MRTLCEADMIPQISGYQPDGSYLPNPYFMERAIAAAVKESNYDTYPSGAVVTVTDFRRDVVTGAIGATERIISIGQCGITEGSAENAPVLAIRDAELIAGRRKLKTLRSVLYVTQEPAPLGAGLVANSKINTVVIGSTAGDLGDVVDEYSLDWPLNEISGVAIIRGRIEHGIQPPSVIERFMRNECVAILKHAAQLLVASGHSQVR